MQNKHFLWSYILNNKSLLRYWVWVLWNKILVLHSFVFHGVMSKGQDCCCMSVPLGSGFHDTKPWVHDMNGSIWLQIKDQRRKAEVTEMVSGTILANAQQHFTHAHTSQPHTCTNGFPVVYRGHLREKVSRWRYFTIIQYHMLWMKGKLMKMSFFVFCALRFNLISFLCNVLISNKLQFLIFYLTFISLLPEE